MIFTQLIDHETSTYTYLLADEHSLEAVIIDSVYENADRDSLLIHEMGLKLKYIIDTHLHADHITGSGELRKRTGAKTAISHLANVSCVDWSLKDGDEVKFGSLSLKAIDTPGHTNSCMSFYSEGMIFTGDVLLINGCGRTDFQQGDSQKMYESITQKIFSLPIDTKVYPSHDYKGLTYSTIAREKKYNPRVGNGKSLIEFQKIMSELELALPKKIDTAVPANKNCGNHLI